MNESKVLRVIENIWTQPIREGFLISRVPRYHAGWQSVTYNGNRYQLHGGIRTDYFIDLASPIKGKAKE